MFGEISQISLCSMKYRFLLVLACFFCLTSFKEDPNQSRLEYIEKWKDEAIFQMYTHKIPASITLAQGILESRSGLSRLATDGNNHFGIKCHNDWDGGKIYEDDETKNECFRKYKSAKESFEDHSLFLLKKRYEPLFKLKTDDYKGWAKGLRECGYATNKQYADLLIKIIEDNKLHEYDKIGMEHIKKNKAPKREGGSTDKGKKKDKDKSKDKGKKDSSEGTDLPTEINIGNGYPVELSSNRVKYVVAKGGETQEGIASEFEMSPWQIRKYNDLEKGMTFVEGDIIYLQPKRNKASSSSPATYTPQAGETLRDISQKFAIKLKSLEKMNEGKSGEVRLR
jgi:LysM repeat protein